MLKIRRVLCPVDFSALSDRELQLAVEICDCLGARLVLQHNIEAGPPVFLASTWMYSETHRLPPEGLDAEARRRIAATFSQLPQGVRAEARVTHGHLDDAVLHLARVLPADLIVMGTHGRSSPEHLSHTNHILAHSPCAVLTLREQKPPTCLPDLKNSGRDAPLPVLVPLDFSNHSLHPLEYAFALAELFPLALELLHIEPRHAWTDLQGLTHLNLRDQPGHRLQRARERLRGLVPVNYQQGVQLQVRSGEAAEEIVACAEAIRASLIIMGTHPKSLLNRLVFGKTSLGVLHRAPCPVWIVPVRHQEQHWILREEQHDPAEAVGP